MVNMEEFQNPPVRYRIKPFWFWNGDMKKEEITHQIEEMKDKGLGGMFICARQGLSVPYLSGQWFELVQYACKEAKRCGLESWLYDEYPYPSGMSGGEVLLENPEAEHMILRHFTERIQGGENVEMELGWGRILFAKAFRVCPDGETDWTDSRDLTAAVGNLQMEKIYQQTGLTRYNNKRFFSYGPKKLLCTVLPEGEWRIEVYTEEAMGDFKYYGGYFDPCNREAVKTFLRTTHERYKTAIGDQFGDSVHGMFSDEVGLHSPVPWSKLLPEAFERDHGYSLTEYMPALHDDTVKNAHKIRYDLYSTAHRLFRESYHRQVSEWCRENHLSYATEVPSMRMGTQKYSDVIGGDTAHEKLGVPLESIYDKEIKNYRANARSVSALARQLNKKYAMIESFHSVGWTMTLQDAKWMIDRLGSSGINLYNFHAFYYTIQDITKHDAPPSQFLQNPYWKYYRELADYVGRMGVLVTNTEADIQVAVLDPAAALWTKSGDPFHGFPYKGESEKEEEECNRLRGSWVEICKNLLFHYIDYDHLDAELLSEALVKEGEISLGRASYSVVILPPCHCMESKARKRLEEFVRQGGCLIAAGMLPEIGIDGGESDEETKRAWERLFAMKHTYRLKDREWDGLADICREHIQSWADIKIVEGEQKDMILSTRIEEDGSRYVFAVNQGGHHAVLRIIPDMPAAELTAEQYDLQSGKISPVMWEEGGLSVSLEGYESRWYKIGKGTANNGAAAGKIMTIPMDGLWEVTPEEKNICRFAEAELSLDRIEWKKTEVKTFIEQCCDTGLLGGSSLAFHGMFGTPRRLTPAYPLTCWYRVIFEADEAPEDLCLLMDRETVAGEYTVSVNGQEIGREEWKPVRVNDQNNQAANISSRVRPGENRIEIRVAIAKDEDGLRDPVYLWGTFGVAGSENGLLRLTGQPVSIRPDAHWYEGFPYYSGTLNFKKTFPPAGLTAEEECDVYTLKLKFTVPSYDCIEVLINGQSLGVRAYTPYEWTCERSLLKQPENVVTVRVTNTLANMLDGTYFDYGDQKLAVIHP